MKLSPAIKPRLPANYQAASAALERCSRVDECKSWADKAKALASYAFQVKDRALYDTALKIRGRAIRRAGELLKQIEAAKNQHDAKLRARDTGGPSRTQAASEAGLSDRQRKTALRVANVPADRFEAMVDAERPATVKQLADAGRKPARRIPDPLNRDPKDFQAATRVLAALRTISELSNQEKIGSVLSGCSPKELARLKNQARKVDRWLLKLLKAMGGKT